MPGSTPLADQLFEYPVGSIIPILGTFDQADNAGTYLETGVLVNDEWQLCDGVQISDSDSPFDGRFVPKLDNDFFLQGNSTRGSLGTLNTITPSADLAETGNYIPAGTFPHSHDIDHDHGNVTTGAENGLFSSTTSNLPVRDTFRNADNHTHATSQIPSFVGLSSSPSPALTAASSTARTAWFKSTPVNIEPVYLSAAFYQRIK